MTSFKRARSDEQRAERRRDILDTAAAMLTEMRAADLSLNELSRRVGLAKSNVLRYFESREAVLLELLITEAATWLDDLADRLANSLDLTEPVTRRGDLVAAATAASLARRPVLCDLISQQAAVLERNVSSDAVSHFKFEVIKFTGEYADLVKRCLPEMRPTDAWRLASASSMTIGALWTHAQPSPSMLAAYEENPRLSEFRVNFEVAARDLLAVLISGFIARTPR